MSIWMSVCERQTEREREMSSIVYAYHVKANQLHRETMTSQTWHSIACGRGQNLFVTFSWELVRQVNLVEKLYPFDRVIERRWLLHKCAVTVESRVNVGSDYSLNRLMCIDTDLRCDKHAWLMLSRKSLVKWDAHTRRISGEMCVCVCAKTRKSTVSTVCGNVKTYRLAQLNVEKNIRLWKLVVCWHAEERGITCTTPSYEAQFHLEVNVNGSLI